MVNCGRTKVLGLDIGGANLKMAHINGCARTMPFELWKHPDQLSAALANLLASASPFDEIAVTMTGELCDCYQSKRDGVNSILDALGLVSPTPSVSVWRNDGRFVSIQD